MKIFKSYDIIAVGGRMENLFRNETKPDLRIYGVDNFASGVYFLNEADLYHAVANYEIPFWSNIIVLEYYHEYAGRKDVIKKTDKEGKMGIYAVESTNELRLLDIPASMEQRSYIWKIIPGNLRNEYEVLKNLGINFTQDLYQEEEKLQELQRRELYKETFKG